MRILQLSGARCRVCARVTIAFSKRILRSLRKALAGNSILDSKEQGTIFGARPLVHQNGKAAFENETKVGTTHTVFKPARECVPDHERSPQTRKSCLPKKRCHGSAERRCTTLGNSSNLSRRKGSGCRKPSFCRKPGFSTTVDSNGQCIHSIECRFRRAARNSRRQNHHRTLRTANVSTLPERTLFERGPVGICTLEVGTGLRSIF